MITSIGEMKGVFFELGNSLARKDRLINSAVVDVPGPILTTGFILCMFPN